jgi:ABC-type transport system involved in cytochrome c biogenesis permease subunit
MMKILPEIAFVLIVVSGVFQAVYLFARKGSRNDPASKWLLAAAALIIAVFMADRSLKIGFPALTGTYESLLFYTAVVCAVCSAYRFQKKVRFLPLVQFGATISALVLLSLASSPLIPDEALPPIPALRSYWLVAHVALTFIGESFFIVSFVSSIAFLSTRDSGKRKEYDRVSYTSVALGFPVFTAGALIFGAIWAEQAWGSWWSWDPKETWALVTWLVYSLYLHLRLVRKRKDSLASIVAIAGFLCTLFTFFGVNYLLSGLHSYA